MTIDVANAEPEEAKSLNKRQHLGIVRHYSPEKLLQSEQELVSIPQVSDSEFANNHWMSQHVTFVQVMEKPQVRLAQVVGPH